FFSLSDSKLAPYIVPMGAPLALLTARWHVLHATSRTFNSVAWWSTGLVMLWISLLWLVPFIVPAGLKQTTFLEVAQWAQYGGFAGLACIALYGMATRAEDFRLAVVALSASVCVPLAILMCGSNA